MSLQQRHGLFPRIIGKGDNARRLADLLIRMRSEVTAGTESSTSSALLLALTPSATIENLIIIDREVDFATVLLTQLTYEGLVDEVIGIQNSQAEVDSSIVGIAPPPQQSSSSKSPAPVQQTHQGRKRKIQLDSTDKLYGQLRDSNFAIVGGLLNKVARRLEADYESRHGSKSVSELREFVSKLPAFQAEQQSLKIHTGIAEEIMKHTRSDIFNRILEVQQNLAAGADPSSQHDTIEELIARDCPLPMVLRLLCLESCMSGGLKPKDLDHFKREILHAYGFQHLLTLGALEKLQLLQSRASTNALLIGTTSANSGKTNYYQLRKMLRLIVDEVNEQDPDDIAYVYSGYAPLSIRLVQCVLQKQYLTSLTRGGGGVNAVSNGAGWRGFDDAVKHVGGKTFDEVQRGEEKAVRARQILNGQNEKKTTVVFFLGGITFTEIAALRFIAAKEEGKSELQTDQPR
jgi:vacuolar protein sorting-associated protein 33A